MIWMFVKLKGIAEHLIPKVSKFVDEMEKIGENVQKCKTIDPVACSEIPFEVGEAVFDLV